MTCLRYIITNFINIATAVVNLAICSYSINIVKKNHSIVYDLDVSANCKKVYFFNISYMILAGLFVLTTLPRYICNFCRTRPTLVWNSSDWFILSLIFGVSWWGYTYYPKLNDVTFCDGIFKTEYSGVRSLVGLQLLSAVISIGLYLVGYVMILILKRCDASSKTKSLRKSSFTM